MSLNHDDYEELLDLARAGAALNQRFRTLLVESLDLNVRPEHIGDDQPLFGRGLELDSLDTLEIVVMFEEHLGVTITDDDRAAFGSVNRLVDFVVDALGEIPRVEAEDAGVEGSAGARRLPARDPADEAQPARRPGRSAEPLRRTGPRVRRPHLGPGPRHCRRGAGGEGHAHRHRARRGGRRWPAVSRRPTTPSSYGRTRTATRRPSRSSTTSTATRRTSSTPRWTPRWSAPSWPSAAPSSSSSPNSTARSSAPSGCSAAAGTGWWRRTRSSATCSSSARGSAAEPWPAGCSRRPSPRSWRWASARSG